MPFDDLVSEVRKAQASAMVLGSSAKSPILQVTLGTVKGNALELALTQAAAVQFSEALSCWLQSQGSP